jgi:hypothetical protein
MTRWYDMDGNELHDMDEVERLLINADARRIAFTELGDVRVSTILLVLDHNFGPGPPMIFETMIFGGGEELDGWCERTPNKIAALAAHDRAVAYVREELKQHH